VEADDSIKDKLEVLYDCKSVPGIYSASLRIVNSGLAPIVPEDFIRPLNIKLDPGIRILEAHIWDQQPNSLEAKVVITDDSMIEIPPLLLNSGWSFSVSVKLDQPSEINLDASIVGIDKIESWKSKMAKQTRRLVAVLVLAPIGGAVTYIAMTKTGSMAMGIILFAFRVLFSLAGLYAGFSLGRLQGKHQW
jgi:hypothetical protein